MDYVSDNKLRLHRANVERPVVPSGSSYQLNGKKWPPFPVKLTTQRAQCQFLSRRKNENEYLYNKKTILPSDVDVLRTSGDDGRYEYDKDPEQSASSTDAKRNSETSIMYDYKEEPWPTITIRFPEERPSPTSSQTRRTFTWRDLFPPLRTTRKYEVTEISSIPSQTTRDLDENTFKFVDWSAVTAVSNEPSVSSSKIGAILPGSQYKSEEASTVANTAVVKDYSLISSFKQTYKTTVKRKLKMTRVSRRMFQPYISDFTYSERSSVPISNSSSDSVYRFVTSAKKTSSRKKDIQTRTSKNAKSNFNISNFTSTSDKVNVHVNTKDFEFVNFGKSSKTYPESPTLSFRRDHHASDDSLKLSSIVNVLKPIASRPVSSEIYPDTSLDFSIPSQSSRDLSPLSYLGNISELFLSTQGGSEISDDTLYLSTTTSYPLAKKYSGDVTEDSFNEPMQDDSDDMSFEIFYYTDDYSLNKTEDVTKIEEVAETEGSDTSAISVHPFSILKRNTPYIMNGIFFDEPTLRVPSSYMYGDYVVFPFTRVVVSTSAPVEHSNSDLNTEITRSTQILLMKWPPMEKKDEKTRTAVTFVLKNKETAAPGGGMFQRLGYPKGVMARRPVFSRNKTRRPVFSRNKTRRPVLPSGRTRRPVFPRERTRWPLNFTGTRKTVMYYPTFHANTRKKTLGTVKKIMYYPTYKPDRKKKKMFGNVKKQLTSTPAFATPPKKNTTVDPANWACYECGLFEGNYSSDACNKVFEPPSNTGRHFMTEYRIKCASHSNNTFRKGFSGCFKRYLDIGSSYEERGCRNYPPTRGNSSFMTRKYVRLEYLLRNTTDGCVTSPHAILVPFSRTIQLYAHVHVCVCSSKYCNRATRYSPRYLPLSLSIFVLLIACSCKNSTLFVSK